MTAGYFSVNGEPVFEATSMSSQASGLSSFAWWTAVVVLYSILIPALPYFSTMLFDPALNEVEHDPAPGDTSSDSVKASCYAFLSFMGDFYRVIFDWLVASVSDLRTTILALRLAAKAVPDTNSSDVTNEHEPSNSQGNPSNSQSNPPISQSNAHQPQEDASTVQSRLEDKLEYLITGTRLMARSLTEFHMRMEENRKLQLLMFSQMNAMGSKASDATSSVEHPLDSKLAQHNDAMPFIVTTVDAEIPSPDNMAALSHFVQSYKAQGLKGKGRATAPNDKDQGPQTSAEPDAKQSTDEATEVPPPSHASRVKTILLRSGIQPSSSSGSKTE